MCAVVHACVRVRASSSVRARAYNVLASNRTQKRTGTRTHVRMYAYTHARTHEFTHARTHACTHARSHARTLVHACTPTNTHAHTRHTHCMRTRSVHGMWHEYQQGWRMACRKDCMQKEKNVPVCATEHSARPASGWRPVLRALHMCARGIACCMCIAYVMRNDACTINMRRDNCQGPQASLSENGRSRRFSGHEAESPRACYDAWKLNNMHG